jgi:hypothetical protein
MHDAWHGRLKPLYHYTDDLPSLEGASLPSLPAKALARNEGRKSSFDLGRGCPFQCSFCTIINVQGRKSRFRTADDLEQIVRENHKQGITSFFITDDNMARNKHWEDFFDRLIELKENDGIAVSLIIQVDTQCHRIPNFIHKARWAGVYRVFIGLENINPSNLMVAKKRQNKITEYRKMLLAWKNAGVITYCGYILGFPGDTRDSILQDVEIIKKELPLDILEFFYLTPLPGSEDHKKLWEKGVWMDPDMNKYDLEHVVTPHSGMTSEQWRQAYRKAWDAYYSPEHLMTVLRRGVATGMSVSRLKSELFFFSASIPIENMHPLQAGAFRLKYRRDRRPGFPIEPSWKFYPRYIMETISKHVQVARHWMAIDRMLRQARREHALKPYTDLALTPVHDDETETLELFTHNESARNEVVRTRKIAELTRGAGRPVANQHT